MENSQLFLELVRRPEWFDEAACRDVPTDVFFPARGASLEAPREVCDGCPVRRDCLEAGMMEKFGIWGGMSERQRRRLRVVGLDNVEGGW